MNINSRLNHNKKKVVSLDFQQGKIPIKEINKLNKMSKEVFEKSKILEIINIVSELVVRNYLVDLEGESNNLNINKTIKNLNQELCARLQKIGLEPQLVKGDLVLERPMVGNKQQSWQDFEQEELNNSVRHYWIEIGDQDFLIDLCRFIYKDMGLIDINNQSENYQKDTESYINGLTIKDYLQGEDKDLEVMGY